MLPGLSSPFQDDRRPGAAVLDCKIFVSFQGFSKKTTGRFYSFYSEALTKIEVKD